MNIIAAFNQLRIAKGEEWKTAFQTHYGFYEYLVKPFGLANAPSLFQYYINNTLRDYLDIFCTVYTDDILIYSNSQEEHAAYVKKVSECLQTAGLQVDISRYKFNLTEVCYLGMIFATYGICIDLQKVQAVVDWETSTCVKDIQAFIGFAKFCWHFVRAFPKVVAPLIALVRKDVPFQWTEDCQKAFDLLKKRFTTAQHMSLGFAITTGQICSAL